jgi:antitoxin PrlF
MVRKATARVTSKGQVTVPVEVRQALGIEAGDDLRFEVETGGARFRVVKRTRLSSLFAALPPTRPFPGKAAVRDAVGKALGKPPGRAGRAG